MKNILLVFFVIFLTSCANKNSTQKKIIKTINISGDVSSVLFENNKYCYTLKVPKGTTIPLCGAKEHYIVGDTISYKKDEQGQVSTKLIKHSKSRSKPVKKATKPKSSQISLPKNQNISFD